MVRLRTIFSSDFFSMQYQNVLIVGTKRCLPFFLADFTGNILDIYNWSFHISFVTNGRIIISDLMLFLVTLSCWEFGHSIGFVEKGGREDTK